MYLKTKWLSKQRNGAGVVFATGTPISNTLNEIYTMLRYLHYDKLKELDIEKFDDFARCFTVEAKSMELTPGGDDFKSVTRLNLTNLPAVGGLFREVADVLLI